MNNNGEIKLTKKELAAIALKKNMQRRKMIDCDENIAISRKSVASQLNKDK